jgi:hypothetical protein
MDTPVVDFLAGGTMIGVAQSLADNGAQSHVFSFLATVGGGAPRSSGGEELTSKRHPPHRSGIRMESAPAP